MSNATDAASTQPKPGTVNRLSAVISVISGSRGPAWSGLRHLYGHGSLNPTPACRRPATAQVLAQSGGNGWLSSLTLKRADKRSDAGFDASGRGLIRLQESPVIAVHEVKTAASAPGVSTLPADLKGPAGAHPAAASSLSVVASETEKTQRRVHPGHSAYSPVNRNSACHGPSVWTTSQ